MVVSLNILYVKRTKSLFKVQRLLFLSISAFIHSFASLSVRPMNEISNEELMISYRMFLYKSLPKLEASKHPTLQSTTTLVSYSIVIVVARLFKGCQPVWVDVPLIFQARHRNKFASIYTFIHNRSWTRLVDIFRFPFESFFLAFSVIIVNCQYVYRFRELFFRLLTYLAQLKMREIEG